MALTLTCPECGLVVPAEGGPARRPLTCPNCRAALDGRASEAVVEERLPEVPFDEGDAPYRRGKASSDKDDELPRTPRKRARPVRLPQGPRDNVGIGLAGAAAVALGLLGLSAWLPFWSFKSVAVQPPPGGWPQGLLGVGLTEYHSLAGTWRGYLFILVSLLSALAVAGAYLGHASGAVDDTDWLDGLGSAVGVAWGMTALLWTGGYLLWWYWVRQPANDQPMPFAGGTLKYVQTPSFGCYAAVALAALGLAGAAAAALWRKRLKFALAGAGAGLLLGGLLVLADVRPWSDRVAWVVTPTEMEQLGNVLQNQFQPGPPPPPKRP